MVLLYFITLLGLTAAAVVPDDFDISYRQYELVYHADHHLLLALHGNDCYYVYVPNGKEDNLVNDAGMIRNRLELTEESILTHIRSHDGLTSSSLEAVRDKYGDMLADFHCLGKHIYELEVFTGGSTSATHTTPIPHQDTFDCATHQEGSYAYVGDCRKYVLCAWGISFIELCAPGTLFNGDTKQCAVNPPCPWPAR